MPDEQGNLLPGDPGYVAPEQPAVVDETLAQDPVETPVVDTPVEETPEPPAPPAEQASTEEPPVTVTQAKYDQLLSAYKKLKVRVGIDPVYEKQLDTEAGLY